jgi:uncharacterized SAM-binding protein YcdF (DUF218 family)
MNLPAASNQTKTLRWCSRSWRRTMMMAVLAGFITCVWLGSEPLLRGAASLWIISDPVTHADAIVVLGGNFQERPEVAADLYRRGLADKILVSQTRGSDYKVNRTALLEFGVPPSAVESFGIANRNTRDEAVALKEWAKRNAASIFIIPSEIFHTRRVRWIFDRVLSGSGVKIEVASFEPPGYTCSEWWKTEQGVTSLRSELLKYIYYRLKY